MKINLKAVSLGMLLATASVSGVAAASCPEGLTVEEHISCIRIEGAGVLYQDYLTERAEILANIVAARTGGASHDISTNRQGLRSKDEAEAGKFSSTLNK